MGQAYANSLETTSPTSDVKLTASDSLGVRRQVNAIVFADPITLSIAGGTTLTVGKRRDRGEHDERRHHRDHRRLARAGQPEGIVYTNASTTTTGTPRSRLRRADPIRTAR